MDAPTADTRVDRKKLAQLLARQTELPADFHPHPKIQRWLELRREMSAGTKSLDWAAGEALAFASLLAQGVRVRMTGQDCERGTFSHRHAVLHDVETGKEFVPLRNLSKDQAALDIYNSSLSEPGVLGFEYGYSLDFPEGLLLWEAQFGDFCNVAQVIIDQFIVSAEEKWRRLSGLTLLLPHGFEGQGPEHSSARLERFLALSADDNIQVVNVTTPAQYFHLLRRQVLRPWRKPLIVMSPKSLLRHPRATSALDDCANGGFQRILADTLPAAKGKKFDRVILCSGKVYYELEEEREKRGKDNVAILRIEQLHPLTDRDVGAALQPYPNATRVVWCQEEPENMGAWRYLSARLGHSLLGRWPLSCVSRPAAASPATGSSSSHKLEQQELLNQAFTAS
jgi:2-oxoglutarate dehydrogenase E1 component